MKVYGTWRRTPNLLDISMKWSLWYVSERRLTGSESYSGYDDKEQKSLPASPQPIILLSELPCLIKGDMKKIKVKLHALQISAFYGSQWSASCSHNFITIERAPVPNDRRLDRSRASLDVMVERERERERSFTHQQPNPSCPDQSHPLH
jgi:hypothetical protein